MKKTLVLEADFNSAHFYNQPQWSEKKNQEVFGRCFTKYGHGHNYKVRVEWDADPSQLLNMRNHLNDVIHVLDHEHLNFVIPEFQSQIPTTEVIVQYLEKKLKEKTSAPLLNIELFETPTIGARLK